MRPLLTRALLCVSLASSCATLLPAVAHAQEQPAPRVLELSLEEAVRIALENNIDLEQERLRQERVTEEISIASAAFDPLFATSYTHAKFRQPTVDSLSGVSGLNPITEVVVNSFTEQNFDIGITGLLPSATQYSIKALDARADTPEAAFFGFNPRNATSVRAELTQPLLRGFRKDSVLADLYLAKKSDLAARYALHRLAETTIANVDNAYWQLVAAREELGAKEQGLIEAQTLLEINRQKVAVGKAKEIDIVDAEANVETQKSGIILARNALEKAQDTLLDLLDFRSARNRKPGELPYSSITVVPTTALEIAPIHIDLPSALDEALASRADLKRAETDLRSAEIERDRKRDQLLPRLDFLGSWTQNGLDENFRDSLAEFGSGRYYDWSVGVAIDYPIGNRRARAELAQSRSDVYSRAFEIEKLRNTVVLEVTQSARDIQSAAQLVDTTRAAKRLREEQLAGERSRLQEGLSTSYQVLQIQNDLLDARTEEVKALVGYRRSVTAFEAAVGRILIARTATRNPAAPPPGATPPPTSPPPNGR